MLFNLLCLTDRLTGSGRQLFIYILYIKYTDILYIKIHINSFGYIYEPHKLNCNYLTCSKLSE